MLHKINSENKLNFICDSWAGYIGGKGVVKMGLKVKNNKKIENIGYVRTG